MPENTMVHTPYNFIPFSNKFIERYSCVEELPGHDRIDPNLKSGEIHMTLRAETPVFVAGGTDNAHFFRNAAGKVVIPGSTVRGMARSNMQILGFGKMRLQEDMDDYQIYFRDMASAKQSTKGSLKEYYHGVLDIKTEKTPSGKQFTVPRNVQAGYLYRDNEQYWIRPLGTPVLRVSRDHPDIKKLEKQGYGRVLSELQRPDDARTIRVSYQDANDRVKSIAPEGCAGMKQGVLLYTGRPVGKNENHLYLFPQEDPDVEPIPVSEEDVLSYQVDFEARKNSLKAYYNVKFWALPDKKERKPVFFVRYDGHIYFGRSMFLRIGYKRKLSKGLPRYCQTIDEKALDYTSAILGFARKQNAYRSRVSFGDFSLIGKPQELGAVSVVLGEPKPSYYPGYVVEGKHYNEEDFQLRGYKQYWLKEVTTPQSGKDNVTSVWHPLAVGSAFHGVIRYKNLTEDELGLLLWSLRLDEGCYQTIGKGKPYGFGRMKVTIDALREFDFQKLYTPDGLAGGALQADQAVIERYIQSYDTYAAAKLKNKQGKGSASLREKDEIKDFFFMKRAIRKPKEVSYMELDEYKRVREPLPEVKMVREEFERREKEKPKTLEDALAALIEKQGSPYMKKKK